jgi:hypothetical protein
MGMYESEAQDIRFRVDWDVRERLAVLEVVADGEVNARLHMSDQAAQTMAIKLLRASQGSVLA